MANNKAKYFNGVTRETSEYLYDWPSHRLATPPKIPTKDKNIKNYTHRSCKPLDEVDFDLNKNQLDMFENECDGVCMIWAIQE